MKIIKKKNRGRWLRLGSWQEARLYFFFWSIGRTGAFSSSRQWLFGLLTGVGAVVWCYRGVVLGGSRLGQSLLFLNVGGCRAWSWTVVVWQFTERTGLFPQENF
ncbi:hypothetical protein I3760_01G097100 [Carya illinoinensis]|nr:hypothetical protein I3760_01G097100 [Carya illinoinensis]